MHSSGLSAVTGPTRVSRPQEWSLDGVNAWEVRSPRQGTPPAKLSSRPRLSQRFPDCSHYSMREHVRWLRVLARGCPGISWESREDLRTPLVTKGPRLLPVHVTKVVCGHTGGLVVPHPHVPQAQQLARARHKPSGVWIKGLVPTRFPIQSQPSMQIGHPSWFPSGTVRQSSLAGGPAVAKKVGVGPTS